jgi:hypothetical protein
MNHGLAKIKNIPLTLVKEILENDKSFYDLQGIHLENIWQNVDIKNEVYFLLRIENINNAKVFIQKMRAATLLLNPDADVAEFIYLSN